MLKFDRNELISALALIAIGAASLWIASGYAMGNIVRMGPGFVPAALSVLLIAIGGALLLLAGQGGARLALDMRWRPVLLILGAMLAWGLLVRRIGFVPSTVVLVVLCSMAEKDARPVPTLIAAAALCLFGYLVFIRGLNIPLPVFGAY